MYLCNMESTRQKKIARLLERDLSEIFQQMARNEFPGILLSVTKVRVSPDLGISHVFISMFPVAEKVAVLNYINEHKSSVRNELGNRVRHQLRIVPDLIFHIDDSIDYVENIERLLRGEGENPIL